MVKLDTYIVDEFSIVSINCLQLIKLTKQANNFSSRGLAARIFNVPLRFKNIQDWINMNLLINGLALITHGLFPSAGLADANQVRPENIQIAGFIQEMGMNAQVDFDPCNLVQMKKEFHSCPYAKALREKVIEEGPIKATCTTEEYAPTGAKLLINKREILISMDNKQGLFYLLFEISNLHRVKEHFAIHHGKCTLSVDQFAELIERSEYRTYKDSRKIARQCIQDGYWPEEIYESWQDEDWTIEEYLKKQEEYGHTEFYRVNWFHDCKRIKVIAKEKEL